MEDPEGVWKSLNWITVPQVRSIVRRLPELEIEFNRKILATTLERLASDPAFSLRRAPFVRMAVSALMKLGLHRLARFVPPALQPLMDCRLVRRAAS